MFENLVELTVEIRVKIVTLSEKRYFIREIARKGGFCKSSVDRSKNQWNFEGRTIFEPFQITTVYHLDGE